MNGKDYSIYIRQQWDDYSNRKDTEKQQRDELRKQQTRDVW